ASPIFGQGLERGVVGQSGRAAGGLVAAGVAGGAVAGPPAGEPSSGPDPPAQPAARAATQSAASASRARGMTVPSHAGDQLVHPVVVGPERVLAQDGALGLVVELQVDPVDGVVAAALLGLADEL